MNTLKKSIKRLPIIGGMVTQLGKFLFQFKKFPGSKDYWEQRYRNGGNSGSGSYNRLAEFKANFLNRFIETEGLESVIEWGCGDGNQLSLADYKNYVGYDVSPSIIKQCKVKFKNDPTKKFFIYSKYNLTFPQHHTSFDLSLSIDVIFHLVEDQVFENYMNQVFKYASKYVIVYSSNFNSPQTFHEKDRIFTDWITENKKNWVLKSMIKNPYPFDKSDPKNTSKCNFYVFKKKVDLPLK